MKTVILTEVQHEFLLGILSHDVDMIEPLVRDESFDDDDLVALRDLMSFTVNALTGQQELRTDVHAFHGTRETGVGELTIDSDMSLDEGLAVLTCKGHDDTFMGWIDGGNEGKFAQVPKRLADRIVGWLATAERAGWMRSLNEDDLDMVHSFAAAVNRCSPTPRNDIGTPPQPTDQWVISGPYGIEWQGVAENELAALDAWADSQEMARYSDTILHHVLEGHAEEGFGPPVYRLEGVIHAIHSNYEVEVAHMSAPDPPREVRVHLDVAVEPSDKRSADEIGKTVVHYLDANVEITHMVAVEKS